MPLNTDPAALSDEDYWESYDEFVRMHPDSFHEIPADQLVHHDDSVTQQSDAVTE